MSMLLGTRNSYSNINARSTGVGPGVPMKDKPTYMCRTCGVGFKIYAGMKKVGSSIGYCPEHNPPKKEPAK